MKPVFYNLFAIALAACTAVNAQPPEEGRRQEGPPREGRQEGADSRSERRGADGNAPNSASDDRGPRQRPEGRGPDFRPNLPPGAGPGALMPPGQGGFPGRFGNPLLMVIDKNQDGELSEEEIDGAIAALKTLDKNRDRRLDASELRPNFDRLGMSGQPGNPAAPNPAGNIDAMLQRMMSQDRDGDQKLDREELPEGLRPMLEQGDRNSDGKLDQEELRTVLRSRMPQGNPDPTQFAAQMFRRGDINQDGKLTGDEIPPFLRERLEALDTNRDGGLDQQEMQAGMGPMRRAPVDGSGTIRPRRPEGGERPESGDPAARRPRSEGDARSARPGRPEAENEGRDKPEVRDGERREGDRPQGDRPEERRERPESDRRDERKPAEERATEKPADADKPDQPQNN